MGFDLIPVGHRRNIVCKKFELTVCPPAQRLDGNTQVFLKADWIHDVPAVQAPKIWRTALEGVLERIDIHRAEGKMANW